MVSTDVHTPRRLTGLRAACGVFLAAVFLTSPAWAAKYMQEREEMLAAGEFYAQGDVSGYMNALTTFAEKNKSSYWRFDAYILQALVHLTVPSEREKARQILRQVSIDAKDLAYGTLARFMIARSYEEEGQIEQALKEYTALAAYPALPATLEKTEQSSDWWTGNKYFMVRYPTFIAYTPMANELPMEAAVRMAVLTRGIEGQADQQLIATIKTPEAGKVIELVPAVNERKGTTSKFVLRAPRGQAVKSMTVDVQVVAGKKEGKARLRIDPLYPVWGEARTTDFAPDVTRPGTPKAVIQLPAPASVMTVTISWEEAEIGMWRIMPDVGPEIVPPMEARVLSVLPLLSRGGRFPFARGVNNIRLCYEETSQTYDMLLSLPEGMLGRPDTPPQLYVSQSKDGKNWSMPRLLEVSGIRGDKWPEAGKGTDRFRMVWVSDRRGTGMNELFFSSGTNIFDCRMSGSATLKSEEYSGFPAECHPVISGPAMATANGQDYVFFVAEAIGQRRPKSDELAVKRSGIFYIELKPGTQAKLNTVISTGTTSLEKYLGKLKPDEDSPEVMGDTPLSVFVDQAGSLVVSWLSSSGKACYSVSKKGTNVWQTARLVLPGDKRIHELLLLKAGAGLTAVASIEATGVVVYSQEKGQWKEKAVVFKDNLYPWRIGAIGMPDGKVIVVGAPKGIGATQVHLAVVDPATGAVE